MKRPPPLEPPETTRGYRPSTPEPLILNQFSATVWECIGAAQPRFLRLSIWTAPCSRCRSAVRSEGISLRRHRFFARKSGEKTREGAHPLNPAIGSLTIGRLHALCKGVRAASFCGFRFDLLLAAAAALRWGYGLFLFRRSKRVCTAKEIIGRRSVNIRKLQ